MHISRFMIAANQRWLLITFAIFCSGCACYASERLVQIPASRDFQHTSPRNLEIQLDRMRAELKVGRTAEALKLAKELSAAHKDDVQVHFTLGTLLSSSKQYRAAERELELAQALQPESFDILFSLGQTYLRVHEYGKAELVLVRALRIAPDSLMRDACALRHGLPTIARVCK